MIAIENATQENIYQRHCEISQKMLFKDNNFSKPFHTAKFESPYSKHGS